MNMAKINISITNKMLKAMKRYPEINWNKVMIDGFRKEIQRIESKK